MITCIAAHIVYNTVGEEPTPLIAIATNNTHSQCIIGMRMHCLGIVAVCRLLMRVNGERNHNWEPDGRDSQL